LGIALATLDQMPITGCRVDPENGSNGWFIFGVKYHNAPNFYQPLHLSHLPNLLPEVLPYLALAARPKTKSPVKTRLLRFLPIADYTLNRKSWLQAAPALITFTYRCTLYPALYPV
jgi:hypothetical protein